MSDELKDLRDWLEKWRKENHDRWNSIFASTARLEERITHVIARTEEAHDRIDAEIDRDRDRLREKRSYSPSGGVRAVQTWELGPSTRKWIIGIVLALGAAGSGAVGAAAQSAMDNTENEP